MMLNEEDADMFFRLHWSLLFFVNLKYQIIEGLSEPLLKDKNLEDVNKLNDILFNNPELIDSFISENPFNFDSEELGIIKSWKNHIKDRFLLVAHLKKYSVFMTTGKDQKVYGVIGIFGEIKDIVPPFLPQYVETTLLPFKGQIIYCGLFSFYNIRIGSGMRGGIQAEYQKAKRRFGIITSLDTPVREKEDSDEELLKLYVKSRSNRETYLEEIEDILTKKPELANIYHREIGKSNARNISKRLSEIGVAPGWFAIFENVVIASGKSEKEVRAQLADLLPEEKMEGVYMFRYGKKARGK